MKLVADSMVYFSQADEDAFFRWIEVIPGIGAVVGKGTNLQLELWEASTELSALSP